MHRFQLVPIALLLACLPACQGETAAERARRAAETMRDSIPDVDARALAQEVDPSTVREVQQHLQVLNEYQGEASGDLDAVTVNAVQAFQRAAGLRDDGLLDGRTLQRLRSAANAALAGSAERPGT